MALRTPSIHVLQIYNKLNFTPALQLTHAEPLYNSYQTVYAYSYHCGIFRALINCNGTRRCRGLVKVQRIVKKCGRAILPHDVEHKRETLVAVTATCRALQSERLRNLYHHQMKIHERHIEQAIRISAVLGRAYTYR
jgi:hypothetical protein